MKEEWRVYIMYLLVLCLLFCYGVCCAQITVKQFNAEWNKTNGVDWVHDLNEVKTVSYIDISKQASLQKEYKIAVIPTIIIFKDGDEVARFQADLSFKMVATKEEVQEEIDNQLMSDF